MDSSEIYIELYSSYIELVNHLRKKYGAVQNDYFIDESCVRKNPNISRTKEGLQCHHVDEDKAIMLSTTEYAIKNPFKYQKASRLVYCNILEHLLLHIKIIEQPRKKSANPGELVGIGGAMHYLIPQINDFYDGRADNEYQKRLFAPIKDNFDDYINVLLYLLDYTCIDPIYHLFVDINKVSLGMDGEMVDKVYRKIQK